MARIEWVDRELENWALWRLQRDSGGSGWHSGSTVFEIRTRGGYREARIPVLHEDAAVMDQAVRHLEAVSTRLHNTVVLTYLGDPLRGQLTRLGVAEAEGIALTTLHARLFDADRLIAVWYHHRAAARTASK